jgi:hypothetical protein
MIAKTTLDPKVPRTREAEYYLQGEREFACMLYSCRLQCSGVTSEDAIRKHLTELGFKDIPPIFYPRSN